MCNALIEKISLEDAGNTKKLATVGLHFSPKCCEFSSVSTTWFLFESAVEKLQVS